MKIIALKKMAKGKYKVTFDNGDNLNLFEEVIIDNVILYGKEISESLYQKILDDNYKATPYHQALQFIEIRKRSKEELKGYLLKKNIEEELIEEVIAKLEHEGYIDDQSFAKSYISDKLNLSNDGLIKIKKTLGNYKVDENIIDNLLSNIDVQEINDRIDKLIEKQMRINNKYSGNVLKNKIYNYLINLGYDSTLVLERIDMYDLNSSGNIQKEYQKLYKKYNNKYSGYTLDMKIKDQLYKKGYSISEIDNITK